jgi:hypothetical protein
MCPDDSRPANGQCWTGGQGPTQGKAPPKGAPPKH